MSRYFLCAVLILAACMQNSSAELSNSDALLKKSVGFAYFLGDGFIHLISSNSGPTPSLMKDLEQLSSESDIKDVCYIFVKLAWSYLGFCIFFIFGLVFVIFLPIIGLIFFCCRCCGNCGGYTNIMDEKNDPKKRGFYSFILLLLLTLKTAALVIAFINNYLASVAITQQDVSLIPLISDLRAFKTSLITTVKRTNQTNQDNTSNLTKEQEAFNAVLVDAFKDFKQDFRINSSANKIIEPIDNFIKLSRKYNEMSNQRQFTDFLDAYDTLPADLSYFRAEFERIMNTNFSQSNFEMVVRLRNSINKLVVNPSMAEGFQSGSIRSLIDSFSKNLLQIESLGKFNRSWYELDVEKEILEQLNDNWRNLSNDKERRKSLAQSFSDALDEAQMMLDFLERELQSNAFVPTQAAEYELRFRYYVGYGLLGIPSLIALCLYFGVCFGICGKRPYSDGSVCTKNVGANFLMAAVILIFLLAPILMIVCISLFTSTGVVESTFCGPLKEPSCGSTTSIDTMYRLLSKRYRTDQKLKWLEDLTPFNSIWIRCKDESLVNAFGGGMIKLPIDKDLREILDDLTKKIEVNEMKNTIKNAITQTLETLKNLKSNYASLNFDSSISALNEDTTIVSLPTLIADLRELSPSLFEELIAQLEKKVVQPFDLKKRRYISSSLQELVSLSVYWEQANTNMEQFNSSLDTNLNNSINEAIARLSEKLLRQLRLAVMAMWQPIDCKDLYAAAHRTTDTTCQGFIQPFNGYLYGLGFCVILYIPILVFSILLVGLYRKSVSYDDEVSEANYMNYQGFYMADPSIQGDTKKKSKRKSKKGPSNFYYSQIGDYDI